MSIVSKTILKSYFETGDFPTQAQFENLIDTLYPYEKYVALLTQSGTGDPTATVLENTLSGNIVWTYSGVGDYTGTLSGAFTINKVVTIISPTVAHSIFAFRRTGNNTVRLSVRDESGNNIDELLSGTPIEIRVYP